MYFSRGFRVGSIGGIAISLDYSWFIIFGLFVFLLAQFFFPLAVPGLTLGAYWGVAAVTTLLFFISVLVHELAHSVVARRSGLPVNNIMLFIFGGMSQIEDEPDKPWDEFKIAIVGPLTSLGLGVLFFGVTIIVAAFAAPLLVAAFTYLWFINVVLAVFNMLPAFPLDGGRVFRAALWRFTGNLRRATRIASIVGQGFGWILIAWGVGSLFVPALAQFGSVWLALIGWFLISAARNSYQQLLLRESLRDVPIREVMNRNVPAVAPEITVERLVREYFMWQSAPSLPVEVDGMLVGMVSVDDVRALPRAEWERTLVRDVMRPVEEAAMLRPDDDAWDATNRMTKAGRDQALVAEDGHVEGVVTRDAIARWLQTHTRWASGQA